MEHGLSLSDLPGDVIAKILAHLGASSAIDVFKCKTLCKAFARAGEKDEVYLRIEVDSIFSLRFNFLKFELLALLREKGNPNMLFRDGVVKVFYIGDEAVGKGMLQQAAKLGQSDVTLVLGMLLMAEGGERIAEARRLLNDEYTKAASRRDVVQSVTKVSILLWDHA